MYIPYPKSWILKPQDYCPVYNYKLSENDHKLLDLKFERNLFKSGTNVYNISENDLSIVTEQNSEI